MPNIETTEYKEFIKEIKQRIKEVQIKAFLQVNRTLLEFYWELGSKIVQKEKKAYWGSGFLKNMSRDLMLEFPDIKGLSLRNIKYIRQWYLFYSTENQKGQQVVAQLVLILWGHNLHIVTKCKDINQALFYVKKTIENSWSRAVLKSQIENKLYERTGKALTNFLNTLPNCYVVVELKVVDFEPEFAGKLNFYISAVNGKIRGKRDNPTIGILICKSKNSTIVEYALKDINKPIGVSEYQLSNILPKEFKSSLPSIEEIENELESLDIKNN